MSSSHSRCLAFCMNKRGQVTLFFVLGLVIAVIFVGIYLIQAGYVSKLKSSGLIKTIGLSNDEENVRESVEDCIYETGRDALILIGMQGGYMEPKKYFEIEGVKIAYGYYEGKNVLISKGEIEKEIEEYLLLYLPECVNEIKYDIIPGKLNISVKVREYFVDAIVRYPIDLIKRDVRVAVGPVYNAKFGVRLGNIMSVANTIITKTVDGKNMIDIVYLYGISDDFYVNVFLNDEGRVYMMMDRKYYLDGGNYTFMFAERF